MKTRVCLKFIKLSQFFFVFGSTFASTIVFGLDNQKLSQSMAKILCQENQYFFECFSGSKVFCMKDILEFSIQCSEEKRSQVVKFEKENSRDRSDEYQAILLGSCIGEKFEKKHQSEKKDVPKCYSQKNW